MNIIEEKIHQGLKDLGGIDKFIQKNDRILIKPNFLLPKKTDSAITTHPAFIHAVIRIVKQQGASCVVGDSPGGGSAEMVAKAIGLTEICRQEEVPVISLKTSKKIQTPDGKIAKSIILAAEIFEFDKIINLPKLKTHGLTQITVAIKNLYGLFPGLRKAENHMRFKSMGEFNSLLMELNQQVKPVLNIVDGIIGMEGDGPNSGDPKKMDVIILGADTVSVDHVSASIMNYNSETIPLLQKAAEYKLGGYNKEWIEVKGEELESCIVKDFKVNLGRHSPNMFSGFHGELATKLINKFFIKKPVVRKKDCIGCGECVRVCPAITIKLEKKTAVIYMKKCIQCYCCSEMCPEKAIELKYRPFL